MELINGISQFPSQANILSMGNFDGLHLGHRALLTRLTERAEETRSASVLLSFTPHPLKILRPDLQIKEILGLKETQVLLAKIKLNYLILQDFSVDFSELKANEFLHLIFSKIKPLELVVGYDFRFGHGGQGGRDLLQEYCTEKSVPLHVVDAVLEGGAPISSTRIREALKAAQLEVANRLLGYPFFIFGEIVHGEQKGRQIGFPTLNTHPSADFMLPNGVYKTQASIGSKSYPAITNVGFAPTLKLNGQRSIETHIYDQKLGELEGEIKLEFFKYIRPEKKFSKLDGLIAQINKDISMVKL